MNGFSEEWLRAYTKRRAPQVVVPVVPPKAQQHRAGVRSDVGPMRFRSAWEANFARYLNLRIKLGEIISWRYEPVTFWFNAIKRGVRSYVPDFEIVTESEPPYFVELKGHMDAKSKTKIKRMRIYYPDVKLVVVQEEEYRGLARTVRPLIPTWE